VSADELREASKRVEQLASSARDNPELQRALGEPDGPQGVEIAPEALAVGKRVYVPRLRSEVEILEPPSKGRARVAAGPMRLWVDVSELRELTQESKGQERARERSPAREAPPARPTLRSVDNSLDLRGMRVDDALSLLDAFLDRLYGSGESVAYVEHGFGSGALRDAVRSHLARPSPYVESARAGAPEEGGERLTVVRLR
jgi:DNA mismatch repair protein MutS2